MTAGRLARALGAFLFWGVAQAVFLAPSAPPVPGRPYPAAIPPPLGALVNVGLAAAFVWWFAVRPAARADARRRETFRLRAPAAAVWPWVAGAAAAAAVGINAATLVLPRVVRLPRPNWIVDSYARLPGSTLALFALAVLVAPLLEEFLFRGWLQGRLERRASAWTAIAVTAALFAALHGLDLFGLLPRFALAVGAGYAAWATASIWPSVALHAAYNASVFAGGAVLPRLLPRATFTRAEGWADAERAAFALWARDPRVFVPALVALAGAGVTAAWCLRRAAEVAGEESRAGETRPLSS